MELNKIKADSELVFQMACQLLRVADFGREMVRKLDHESSTDDAEGVTEERVVAAGFSRVVDGPMPEYLSPESVRGGPVVQIRWSPVMGCDGWMINRGDLLPPFETMGQLRSTCYGLGIELSPSESAETTWTAERAISVYNAVCDGGDYATIDDSRAEGIIEEMRAVKNAKTLELAKDEIRWWGWRSESELAGVCRRIRRYA